MQNLQEVKKSCYCSYEHNCESCSALSSAENYLKKIQENVLDKSNQVIFIEEIFELPNSLLAHLHIYNDEEYIIVAKDGRELYRYSDFNEFEYLKNLVKELDENINEIERNIEQLIAGCNPISKISTDKEIFLSKEDFLSFLEKINTALYFFSFKGNSEFEEITNEMIEEYKKYKEDENQKEHSSSFFINDFFPCRNGNAQFSWKENVQISFENTFPFNFKIIGGEGAFKGEKKVFTTINKLEIRSQLYCSGGHVNVNFLFFEK